MSDDVVSIEIPRPDDWHVHLRDDDMLAAVVGFTSRRYRYAMVMPNLRPPIVSSGAAEDYRRRILDLVADPGVDFRPVMTLFVSDAIDLADLRAGHARGVVKAVKFYPAGATTNSDQARGRLADFGDLYDELEDLGMRLLIHAESTRADVDVFDREAAFLHDELAPLCADRPGLRITLEHVSTAAGVEFVRAHPNVAATVTPHHLSRDRGDLLADGLRPDLYCKPIINSPDDRAALVAAVTAEQSNFVFGSDSAPHPATAKYGPRAAAGVFNAPYGVEVVAEVFHRAAALDRLGAFVSGNGCRLYGVDPPATTIRLIRQTDPGSPLDRLTTTAGDEVVFFGVEEAARWRLEPGS